MTPTELSALMAAVWKAPRERTDRLAPHMMPAIALAEINTAQRMAHWLAQVGHESGRGRYLREIWGPTTAQARYEPATSLSATLGNTRSGDGLRYMGRGLIQVTGRANYRSLSKRLQASIGESAPDFEAAPRLLESPDWAAMSAADYWRSRGLNRYADAGDVYTLTRRINGGTNGLADRQALYAHALSVLTSSEGTS